MQAKAVATLHAAIDAHVLLIRLLLLQDLTLPQNITATTSMAEAIAGARFAIHALPVQHSRAFLTAIKVFLVLAVIKHLHSAQSVIVACMHMSEVLVSPCVHYASKSLSLHKLAMVPASKHAFLMLHPKVCWTGLKRMPALLFILNTVSMLLLSSADQDVGSAFSDTSSNLALLSIMPMLSWKVVLVIIALTVTFYVALLSSYHTICRICFLMMSLSFL